MSWAPILASGALAPWALAVAAGRAPARAAAPAATVACPAHGGDGQGIAGATRGLREPRGLGRGFLGGDAVENAPACLEGGIAPGRSVEASDVDEHLIPDRVEAPPREDRYLRGGELAREVFGEDAGDAVSQRLTPLVKFAKIDLVRGGARDDLRPVQVTREGHGADPEGEGAVAGHGRSVDRAENVEARGSGTAQAASGEEGRDDGERQRDTSNEGRHLLSGPPLPRSRASG